MGTTGKRIKAAREHAGITQVTLADRLGIRQAYMSQLENDRSTAPADMLGRIAATLNVSADYLLLLSNEAERQTSAPELPGISEQAEEAARIIDGLVSTAQRQYCLDMIRLFVGYRGDAESELIEELGRVASDVGKPEAHSVAKSIIENQRLGDPAAFLDTTAKRKRPEPLAPIN